MTILQTNRLILRHWKKEDFPAFAALNADPRVMEYFPSTLSSQESDALAERFSSLIQEQGWGLWAVSVPGVSDFIGFIGLNRPTFEASFTPTVEIGWRLAFEHWGKGYATEGAKAALAYGFDTLDLKEIVSFTAVPNLRSRHVMEKLGMKHDAKGEFDHPKVPEGSPLKRHVLYRLSQEDWRKTGPAQKYVYKPYSRLFPALFEQEKERILSSLKNILAIEHVGSTAIPGLGGKGIIDILVAVEKNEMEHACKQLELLGYKEKPFFNSSDRLYLVVDLPDPQEGVRRYHIHLTYPSGLPWEEMVRFRDYLRKHPEAKEEYAALKQHATALADQDGKLYRAIKEPIFQKIKQQIQDEDHGKSV